MPIKPTAVIAVDAHHAIHVYTISHAIEDSVEYKWVDGAANNKLRTARIRYNAQGDAYFISDGRRYYLHHAIRI